jgi:hypothetical protein
MIRLSLGYTFEAPTQRNPMATLALFARRDGLSYLFFLSLIALTFLV